MDENDLDRELRSFLDHLTDEKLRQGMTPAEARRAAGIEFGGLTQIKEECRDGRRLAGLESVRQDLRYAFRVLVHNPGFALTVIGALALGIGCNASVFSIVHAILPRPLPYPESDRLAAVSMLAGFSAAALLLASIGVYGVMAYLFAQRTREIGVRVALGARPPEVLCLVLGRGIAPAALGAAIGCVAALALTRFLASLLFEVRPAEPGVFAVVAVVLFVTAAIACVEPARRALRVDPATALRWE
jgi:ABC-type antimicrobial peptide transport system permease subunit